MTAAQPAHWHALGAQLLQAGSAFYLGPKTPAAGKPWRGGVPVLFPQFAQRGQLPKHGFARGLDWVRTGPDAWLLHVAPSSQALWPHAALLELRFTPRADGIEAGGEITLSVSNTGHDSFRFTGGLHPYWAVENLQDVTLSGLSGLTVEDLYLPMRTSLPPTWQPGASKPLEVLADGCPALLMHDGARQLRLQATGFTEWMIWNPGESLAADLGDMPAADWTRFLCVEPVCVNHAVELAPEHSRCFTLKWELL